MLLLLLAYIGGVLTIVSPCILPVLPFVFARSDKSFLRNGLPTLIGMAATFAVVASIAAVGGGWAVAANQYGRYVALGLVALFGLALVFPELSERLTQPLVSLGDRLSRTADAAAADVSITPSLLLGVAIGLLWAPCAGPVLGLILTGAALNGASTMTTLLLAAYAAGAATSLALALLAGGRVFAAMKRSLGIGEWVRRAAGVLVLVAAGAIAMGADTGALTRLSLASTAFLEQHLVDAIKGRASVSEQTKTADTSGPGGLPIEGKLPPLAGAVAWLNSPPLTREELAGKVVLVDFWTYSCINCLRALPYVKAWAAKYKDQGLVVIGVHAPEFAFEKNMANVERAVSDLGITYPVAIDNSYAIWRGFNNEYWPAHYFIDGNGNIRHHHFGEGDYEGSERVIRQLLAEEGGKNLATGVVSVSASGIEAAALSSEVKSPETYLGYRRAESFASPGGAVRDVPHEYAGTPATLNNWTLNGNWTITPEHASLNTAPGSIIYKFHARDLHLVLGPEPDGTPINFRVTIDGKPPGDNHGTDVDADGNGTVSTQRLYQLVRQSGSINDRVFEIRFLSPGVEAFAFTFG